MPQNIDQGAVFDPRQQVGSPSGKIVAALEQISQAFHILL